MPPGLSLEDGAATLTEMTAAAVAAATRHFPAPPREWLVTGGGRHNPAMMEALARRLGGYAASEVPTPIPPPQAGEGTVGVTATDALSAEQASNGEAIVRPVEAVGWNGDALEAQAFAWLAVRSVRGLPLSLPSTTGAPLPGMRREAVSGVTMSFRSEPRQVGKRQLAAMDVQPAQLGAAVQLREHLAGVEQICSGRRRI